MYMKTKMFETKGRLGSMKEKVFKRLRLTSYLGENSPVSKPTSAFTVAPLKPVNSLTDYVAEAELKKAEAIMYWRMLDRPK